jgi:hypothetical protein
MGKEKSVFLEMIKRRRKLLVKIDKKIDAVYIPKLDLRQVK